MPQIACHPERLRSHQSSCGVEIGIYDEGFLDSPDDVPAGYSTTVHSTPKSTQLETCQILLDGRLSSLSLLSIDLSLDYKIRWLGLKSS